MEKIELETRRQCQGGKVKGEECKQHTSNHGVECPFALFFTFCTKVSQKSSRFLESGLKTQSLGLSAVLTLDGKLLEDRAWAVSSSRGRILGLLSA